MRPTPIPSCFSPAFGLGAAVSAFLSTTVRAADGAASGGPAFDGATIVAALCFFLAPFLIFATVYFRRRFREADARAAELEARLEREQALLESAPQAIVCWDLVTGEQKISEAAARMIGCDQADALNGERIAEIVSPRQRAEIRTAIDALVASGKPFPFPVWRRLRTLDLDYVNPAYRDAVEAASDADAEVLPELAASAVAQNGRALATQAAETRDRQTETHRIVAAGDRRLMELTEAPIGADGAIGGFAIDRTEAQERSLRGISRTISRCCTILVRRSPFSAPTSGSNFTIPPM